MQPPETFRCLFNTCIWLVASEIRSTILLGCNDNQSYLVLEYIEFHSPKQSSMAQLGQALANLHKTTSREFGWPTSNYIGSTPQKNKPEKNWPKFFLENRLCYQINLAENNGLRIRNKNQLFDSVPMFFESYTPLSSLLHGDLWIGNIGFTAEGSPVIFDPASYFGDREADLAFTEMFGGFSSEFYIGYNNALPLDPGYEYRKRLYNLYHELNHYNLFGGDYGDQAKRTIKDILQNQ